MNTGQGQQQAWCCNDDEVVPAVQPNAGNPSIGIEVTFIPNFNLSAPRFLMLRDNPELTPHADRIETEYRQYLLLSKLEPSVKHSPTKEVDKLWHAHILCTKQYVADTQDYFGYYLHHNPKTVLCDGDQCDGDMDGFMSKKAARAACEDGECSGSSCN